MKKSCEIKLHGVVTVGPKGQIVIPKEVRDILKLETGDSLVTLVKDGKFLGFVRNQDLPDLMTEMQEYMQIELK